MKRQAALDAHALRVLARRDVSTVLAGAYRSAFRGRGLTFEELRDYSPGDEMRFIDWNATARLGRPIVKRMREERDVVLALLVDVSDSMRFGSGGESKGYAARRAAAALATAATLGQDRVALCAFAGNPIASVGPGAGPVHLERVFQALGRCAGGGRTDPRLALDWAVDRLPRHTVAVLLSDFLFGDPGAGLRKCARKHELIALRIADPADELPRGLAPVRADPAEEGRRALLRSRRSARAPAPVGIAPLAPALLRGVGCEVGTLWTGSKLVPSLHRFFEKRARGIAA